MGRWRLRTNKGPRQGVTRASWSTYDDHSSSGMVDVDAARFARGCRVDAVARVDVTRRIAGYLHMILSVVSA
jgi:hypothetical protein